MAYCLCYHCCNELGKYMQLQILRAVVANSSHSAHGMQACMHACTPAVHALLLRVDCKEQRTDEYTRRKTDNAAAVKTTCRDQRTEWGW